MDGIINERFAIRKIDICFRWQGLTQKEHFLAIRNKKSQYEWHFLLLLCH